MQAMVLNELGGPLAWSERVQAQPGPGEVRVAVSACGVCRTDLHVVDGELPDPTLPIVPGHEIVGRIDALAGAFRVRIYAARRHPDAGFRAPAWRNVGR
jgi:propanol-preferring alcohol dehydrogenase